jgi:hypothetical protein
MFPVFIQRWCWNLQDFLEKRNDHPRRDQTVLAQYRRRFRRGPFGTWLSALDDLTEYGSSIEFRRDFTGTIYTWGLDDEEIYRDFRWKVVGDLSIDVQPIDGDLNPDDWGVIEYDFKVARTAYGRRRVLMYSTIQPPGFWWSAHPMALAKDR